MHGRGDSTEQSKRPVGPSGTSGFSARHQSSSFPLLCPPSFDCPRALAWAPPPPPDPPPSPLATPPPAVASHRPHVRRQLCRMNAVWHEPFSRAMLRQSLKLSAQGPESHTPHVFRQLTFMYARFTMHSFLAAQLAHCFDTSRHSADAGCGCCCCPRCRSSSRCLCSFRRRCSCCCNRRC